jgi:hypothetical protein
MWALSFIAILLFLQGQTSTPEGVITGQVTMGGKAAPGIPVALMPADPTFLNQRREPVSRTTTGADGQFRITGIAPGQYNIVPLAPSLFGPITTNFGLPGKSVTVAEGETVDGVDIALKPGGVITGRILDADSRPIIGGRVNLTYLDSNGRKSPLFLPNFFMFETDDRGVYRIYGLPEGRYLISIGEANDENRGRFGPGRSSYNRVFHPDTTDEASAAVIDLSAGREVTGIDITVGRPEKSYEVTGRIVEADTGKPVPNMRYSYGTVGDEGQLSGGIFVGTISDQKGEFHIGGVLPGRYAVYPTTFGENNYYGDPIIFDVRDGNVSGLEIKVRQGASISGKVVLEGTTDSDLLNKMAQLEVAARQQTEMRIPISAPTKINSDGSFKIVGLRPGKASVYLGFRSSKGFSLLRVERNGAVQGNEFEIAPGEQVTNLNVIVGYGTGVVRGEVKFEGGEMPQGARLFVMARRTDSSNFQFRLPSQVDIKGHFVIDGLSTGDYELRLSGGFSGPQAPRKPLPSITRNVTVTSGATTDVTLTINLSEKNEEGNQ